MGIDKPRISYERERRELAGDASCNVVRGWHTAFNLNPAGAGRLNTRAIWKTFGSFRCALHGLRPHRPRARGNAPRLRTAQLFELAALMVRVRNTRLSSIKREDPGIFP